MSDVIQLIKYASEVGVPILLSVVAIIFLWGIVVQIPKLSEAWADERHQQELDRRNATCEQQRRYDELLAQHHKQLEIITAVAQQGIEAQKRGNTVIEQNTMAFSTSQKVNEQMILSIQELKESNDSLREDLKDNCSLTNNVLTEVIRVSEIVRK